MTEAPESPRRVIPRDAVRRVSQPVLLDCGAAPGGKGPLVVVPLLDGDRVAGLEIRCSCGASAVVECIYESEAKT